MKVAVRVLGPSWVTADTVELYANGQKIREARIADFLVNLNQRLQREVRYMIRMEPGIQTPEDTLKFASGSCRP